MTGNSPEADAPANGADEPTRWVPFHPGILPDAERVGREMIDKGEYQKAAHYFWVLSRRVPNRSVLYNLRSIALQRMHRFDESMDCLLLAAALEPNKPEILFNIGNTLRIRGEVEAAPPYFRAAVHARPDSREFNLGLAMALLQTGQWQEGFRLYQHRWSYQRFRRDMTKLGFALWEGEPLAGKHILLASEQGAGDTIHFIRYAASLVEAGAEVTAHVPAQLTRLIKSAKGVSEANSVVRPGFDVVEMIMNLPGRLGTVPETIPAAVPYLTAPPPPTELPKTGRPRVALAWGGNPRNSRDRWRRCPPQVMARLSEIEGIDFYALTKGAKKSEIAVFDGRLTDLQESIEDFADVAGYLTEIDLLISVDTALVHLAGALDRPVWTLLTPHFDWRWLAEGDRTDWYPSMTLYRQAQTEDWTQLIDRIAVELLAWRDAGGEPR